MANAVQAELSSITAQIDELRRRVTEIGDRFRSTPDSQFVNECNAIERNLLSTLRAIERATKHAAD
jgi:hypothetical protein